MRVHLAVASVWAALWATAGIGAPASGSHPATKDDVPPAGGLVELPKETTEPVQLVNSGFEEQWAGWKPSQGEAFSISVEPGAARSGRACLRFDGDQATPYTPSVRQPLAHAGPGVYTLRFWLKLQAVGSKAQGQGVRASIEYVLEDGQRAWPSTAVFRGTCDWREEQLRVFIPAHVKPGSVFLSLHRYGGPGGGQAYFDDLTLSRLVPPPVEAFLVYPNYRGFLPEDGPGTVRLWVKTNQAGTNEPVTVETRSADTERIMAVQTLQPGVAEQTVDFDAAGWPAGRYLIEARRGRDRYPAYLVHKITAHQRRSIPVWFDANHVLHLQNKPVFPLGLYNTTQRFPNRNEEFEFEVERARLGKMAEAPVTANINYWFWFPGTEVRRRYLGEMAQRGIWFLDTVNMVAPGMPVTPCVAELLPERAGQKTLDSPADVDRFQTRLAETMRPMPAFLGWYTMDERSFAEVPRHFHQYAILRAADPGHPVFGVTDKPGEMAFWRDSLDVFGTDPYCLFNMKAGRPLTMVADWTRRTVEATRGGRPVWIVLQFFQGWSTDRWPTEEELRTMSLMAIVEGARGLFYWSFGHRALLSVREGPLREEYWQRLVRVTKELRSIEAALVAADAPDLVRSVSDPRIRFRARAAEGKWYVFAYLPSERFVPEPAKVPLVEVRFTLADGRVVTRSFRPDFADWFAVPSASR
jgi:hypothetical protein